MSINHANVSQLATSGNFLKNQVIIIENSERRYDLDWLRIALFFLLILYHIGMFYVPWQWHVKSTHAPIEWLGIPMQLMNPWRIPALFIISGIALRFALDKTGNHGPFLKKRVLRLLLPILFGMAVICAPQAYLEIKEDGVVFDGFVQFYTGYLAPPWASPQAWTTITPTWNHLWYIVYVLILSVLIVICSAVLRGRLQSRLDQFANYCSKRAIGLLIIPMLISFFILWLLKDSVGAVQIIWGDWHRLANSFWLMLFGFAIAKHAECWKVLRRYKWWMVLLALVLGMILTMANLKWFWVGSQYDPHYYITRSFYSWAVMLALLGFVQLLKPGSEKVRRYLNDAVFPYYVLHQTVIIVLGVWLSQFKFGFLSEIALLIAGTAMVTAVFFHLVIRNIGQFALLFGGRPR